METKQNNVRTLAIGKQKLTNEEKLDYVYLTVGKVLESHRVLLEFVAQVALQFPAVQQHQKQQAKNRKGKKHV